MEIQQDFRELLALFNKHAVEYLIVGGYALAFHGAPRFTGDMDIFVAPNRENAERVIAALDEFGFGSLDLDASDFTKLDNVVQLGVPPVRIDLITSISGLSWKQAFESRIGGAYGSIPVFFIGREALIANKRATSRTKDLADIEALDREK